MRSLNRHAHGDRGGLPAVGQTAAVTPHSPTGQLPLYPPSPYKSKLHRKYDGHQNSVAAAFMRRRRAMLALAALSAAAAPPPHTEGVATSAEISPLLPIHALDIAGTPSRDAVDDSAVDDTVFKRFFYETRLRSCVYAEENTRNHILACEEVAFTNLIIEALQARAELLAGDEAAEIVIGASRERAQERRSMMVQIEKEVAMRLHNQRMEELLAREFEALLPAHAAGYERILREEAQDLHELFQWQKEHRPLGGGCFIKGPGEDYRLRKVSQNNSVGKRAGSRLAVAKGSRAFSSVRSSRMYLAELLQKSTPSPFSGSGLGPLTATKTEAAATLLDGTLPATDEAVFAEEGRVRLQEEKRQRHRELRELWEMKSLEGAAAEAREYVLAEEAMCWMQITRLEVEGVYEALEATRERKRREAIEGDAAAQREQQKKAVKERLLLQRGLPVPQPDDGEGADAGVVLHVSGEAIEEASRTPRDEAAVCESVVCAQPRRRSSASTVPDDSSPASGALQEETGTPVEGSAAADDDLAHLRLIAVEITDRDACKQLTALTKRGCDEETSDSA
ncbi:hypothetical protein LSCM4_02852 [Leishmania orientalis]|uniref:Uncharacterized protein n=1 Tax=Leishmania orientalis TaxID=2249476 RepID=A0A836H524_9TRYP|nr:hypothetical protein LSCM4_02852 [Leishmania orientalis]